MAVTAGSRQPVLLSVAGSNQVGSSDISLPSLAKSRQPYIVSRPCGAASSMMRPWFSTAGHDLRYLAICGSLACGRTEVRGIPVAAASLTSFHLGKDSFCSSAQNLCRHDRALCTG
jgi:hypothetical protein